MSDNMCFASVPVRLLANPRACICGMECQGEARRNLAHTVDQIQLKSLDFVKTNFEK